MPDRDEQGRIRRSESGDTNRERVRRMGVSPEDRIEQERGGRRMVSGGRNAPQGIANRRIDEEVQRQSKVVPIRNEGKTTRKRRAS